MFVYILIWFFVEALGNVPLNHAFILNLVIYVLNNVRIRELLDSEISMRMKFKRYLLQRFTYSYSTFKNKTLNFKTDKCHTFKKNLKSLNYIYNLDF